MKSSECDLKIEDWVVAGLRLPSILRVHKIASLEKTLVDRQLGRLSSADLQNLREKIKELFENL
jgi:mRNA interferase MazF